MLLRKDKKIGLPFHCSVSFFIKFSYIEYTSLLGHIFHYFQRKEAKIIFL